MILLIVMIQPFEVNKLERLSRKQYNSSFILKEIIWKYKIKNKVQKWLKMAKNSKHRLMVLKQWGKTQESYVNDLKVIQRDIQGKFIEFKLISDQQSNLMFRDLESMIILSTGMAEDINNLIATWNPLKTLISPKVITLSNYFKIYRDYCNNYIVSKDLVKKLGVDHPKIIGEIEQLIKMDIDSYLIKPIQRPTKYKLLLRQFQKKMSVNHDDYDSLSKAIETYHNIVQANNRTMQQQELKGKMIRLEKNYGGILQNARVLISQAFGTTSEHQMIRMYIFNDLILCTKFHGNQSQQKSQSQSIIDHQNVCERIYLNQYSFVEKPRQSIYFLNSLFICGNRNIIHVTFRSMADRDRYFEIINKNIQDIFQRQDSKTKIMMKNQNRKKEAISVRMSQNKQMVDLQNQKNKLIISMFFMQKNVHYQAQGISLSNRQSYDKFFQQKSSIGSKIGVLLEKKVHYDWKKTILNLQFSWVGVEKRGESYQYIVDLTTPLPSRITQRLFIDFNSIIEIQYYFKQVYKDISFPLVEMKPKNISNQEYKNDQAKVIEFRSSSLIKFLNFVFRSEVIMKNPQLLALRLGICQKIWEFVTNTKISCDCSFCENLLNEGFKDVTWSYYKKNMEDFVRAKIKKNKLSSNPICLNYTYSLISELQKKPYPLPKSSQYDLENLLIAIKCKERKYIMPYIFPPRKILSPLPILFKLPVTIMNLNPILPPNKPIIIPIYQNTMVGDVLQHIRNQLKLLTIRDYSLCLRIIDGQNEERLILDEDELVMKLIGKGTVVQNYTKQDNSMIEKQSEERNSFIGFFRNVSKKIQQITDKHNPVLFFFMKKTICLQKSVEVDHCNKSEQKLNLIVGQIFYRFKYNLLNVNYVEVKLIVSIYYALNMLKNQFSQTKFKNFLTTYEEHQKNRNYLQQIDIQIIKEIVPQKKINLFTQQFKEEMMNEFAWLKKAHYLNSDKIYYIYKRLLDSIIQKSSWNTQYFNVINLDLNTFKDRKQNKKLLLGINPISVTIEKYQRLKPLLTIPLKSVKYRFGGFKIYLEYGEVQYKFSGNNLTAFIRLLEMYQNISIQ